MKRILAAVMIMGLFLVMTVPAFAGGDKVRGEKGQGEVNQNNFDNQGNQN